MTMLDIDATDMDMIRRGDMLGPVLGARVASLIQSQAAESAADKARIAELEAALRPFVFGDSDMADILWGDYPDDAPMKMTLPLGKYRTARSLLNGERTAERDVISDAGIAALSRHTKRAVTTDWKRVDDALVSCAGLLKTLCRDEIGDTAAAELEYVRSVVGRPAEQAVTEAMPKFLKSFCVFMVEDDGGVRFSTQGKVVAHWGEHTPEGMALLRLDADARALTAALAQEGK